MGCKKEDPAKKEKLTVEDMEVSKTEGGEGVKGGKPPGMGGTPGTAQKPRPGGR